MINDLLSECLWFSLDERDPRFESEPWFWCYDKKYDYGHYFSETDDRTTEFFHDKFKDGHHKLDAERNTWNFLRDYYKPGVLSEWFTYNITLSTKRNRRIRKNS